MSLFHTSVLLQEVVSALNVKKDKWYIDATVGGGGHTFEIVKHEGFVLGIDVDEDALRFVEENSKKTEKIRLVRGNFSNIGQIVKQNGIEKVVGILFDLGVSSYQLAHRGRGFSFQKDSPLDMRMDKSLGVSAADLVNALSVKELVYIFERFGEERFAKKIAAAIVWYRKEKKIETTGELVFVIKRAIGNSYQDTIHFATRVFQALRIAVNDELRSLETALPQALEILESDGRLVTISFHSLEDRIIKQSFLAFAKEGKGIILTDKPIMAAKEEIARNPRSRSAKLRVFKKF